MTASPWAVVLAGGDGERVSALTRDAGGGVVPKQFWSCEGQAPMLQWALARARRIAPAPHVLVVVNECHRVFWEPQLADLRRRNLVRQPSNRGTAAGVLLALVEIRARGSGASPVVLLPSDHYVGDEALLHGALAAAVRAARDDGGSVLLLGMTPEDAGTGYGWILPATGDVVSPVAQFVEKPPPGDIGPMVRRGALVNSFILVARVHALLDVIEHELPDVVRAFERGAAGAAGPGVGRLYDELPTVDLSRDVLERAAGRLSVVRVPPCGWTDLGTPERLLRFMARAPAIPPAPRPPAHHAAAA
jgi:mannose-1-phosphate guanylyltransferase